MEFVFLCFINDINIVVVESPGGAVIAYLHCVILYDILAFCVSASEGHASLLQLKWIYKLRSTLIEKSSWS